ncbi:hypothetical protein HNQ88_003606 [Aureibacter tunicatorum]|uniref:Uncharacterized protein n=1 Tax=Aureibacter tunicatorum TaxID=866807 RepID=A0AAE3XQ25_9BACT|nr:hypothetical protein [Aureibacter tunicatorum]BDD06609.1 hypothetical protein AUTU_40920 [Aureibacter tunicatorum]
MPKKIRISDYKRFKNDTYICKTIKTSHARHSEKMFLLSHLNLFHLNSFIMFIGFGIQGLT